MDRQGNGVSKVVISQVSFEAIAQTATDAIIISDQRSIIIFANKRAYQTFGYSHSQLLGLNLSALMPQHYRKGHNEGMARFIDSGDGKLIGHTIEIEGLRKDGSVFPLELSLSSWREGEEHFFSGIIRDTTERKQQAREKQQAEQLLHEEHSRLEAAYEELTAANQELVEKELLLRSLNASLEEKVQVRTHQLKKQQEWLQNLFMQVPALIGLLRGRQGVVTLFNDMFRKLWGNRDVIGKPMREAWPELEGQGYFEFVERVFDRAEPVTEQEYPAMIDRQNNGQLEQAFFTFIYAPFYTTEGEVDGVFIYGEDVTEQVVARKVIEENAERFRFMADAMPQKVWTTYANGQAEYFNQKWRSYSGLSLEELKGWGWKRIVHPDDLAQNERLWEQSLATGADFTFEHRFREKDGEYRWHLSRAIAERNDAGNILKWYGTSTDIHDQKLTQEELQNLSKELASANEELRAANEEILASNEDLEEVNRQLKHINADMDNFIYAASHDLKAPITNVESLLQLLLRQMPGELLGQVQVMRIRKMMEESIKRFKRTIADLTDISKLQKEAGQQVDLINISEVVEEVKLDLELIIQQTGTSITVHMEECPSIHFSKEKLRSIIYNLLSNAIKYHAPDREPIVQVSCHQEADFTVLRVQDNGLGISPQQQEKLFTMFKRFHNHVEGSGVGLYMVKKIVESAGGKIEVESSLGEGSIFSVYLK